LPHFLQATTIFPQPRAVLLRMPIPAMYVRFPDPRNHSKYCQLIKGGGIHGLVRAFRNLHLDSLPTGFRTLTSISRNEASAYGRRPRPRPLPIWPPLVSSNLIGVSFGEISAACCTAENPLNNVEQSGCDVRTIYITLRLFTQPFSKLSPAQKDSAG
jgi:hypothetical protein